jgi:hypothetical protein
MAMTKCPECGHDVSDQASSCPSCGVPLGAPVNASIPPVGAQYAQPYQSFDPPRKSISPLAIVLICFGVMGLCVVVLAAILFPIFASAKTAAKKAATLSNMKQLGTGLAIYLSDFDDVYPLRFASNDDLKEFLGPYTKDETLFSSSNPKGGVFLPNAKLQKYSATEVMDARNTIALFEEKMWSGEGKYYGFVDTHVKFLKTEVGVTFDPKKDMGQ